MLDSDSSTTTTDSDVTPSCKVQLSDGRELIFTISQTHHDNIDTERLDIVVDAARRLLSIMADRIFEVVHFPYGIDAETTQTIRGITTSMSIQLDGESVTDDSKIDWVDELVAAMLAYLQSAIKSNDVILSITVVDSTSEHMPWCPTLRDMYSGHPGSFSHPSYFGFPSSGDYPFEFFA